MLVTISKRANLANTPKEGEFVHEYFNREYLPFAWLQAQNAVREIVVEYIHFNGSKINQAKKEELQALEALQVGDYAFDVGDYTYYVTIEEEC